MKKYFAICFFIIAVTFIGFISKRLSSQAIAHYTPIENQGETIVLLRDQMRKLRGHYLDLENLSAKKPEDRNQMSKIAADMLGDVKMARTVNSDPRLDSNFKSLEKDVANLQKTTKGGSYSEIENSMNSMFENCFRCHLTHTIR